MPQNITDSLTYTTTVQSVADGDAANGANFLIAPQGLANRTAYLKNIVTSAGVITFMNGNASAMQAVTAGSHPQGVVGGSLFFVPAQGWYRYVPAGSATVDNSLVYAATGMGAGQWQHEMLSMANANLGFAAIGPVNGGSAAANKLATSVITNALLSISKVTQSSAPTTASSTYVDIASLTIAIGGCVTGDVLEVAMDLPLSNSSATAVAGINAGGTIIAECMTNASSATMVSIHGTYIVPSSGTVTVKGQFKAVGGGTTSINSSVAQSLLIKRYTP